MAVRNILWCHGGSIQDKEGNVVLNSPETLKALEYAKRLYSVGMTQAVLSWNAASNNQAFNAQETAYILNSISAYRTAQDNKLPVLENYFFVPALKGPTGIQLASEHVMSGYVVWKFSKSQDIAKEFLVALVDASRESMLASKLYNFPSFYGAAAEPNTPDEQEGGVGRGLDRQAVQRRSVRLAAGRQALAAREGPALVDQPRLPRLRESRPRARSSTPT